MLATTRILLLESDPHEEGETVHALEVLGARRIQIAREGLEVLERLMRDDPRDRAELLVLDLGPHVRGSLEVLTAIRDDASLENLPVVVLTTSDEQDRLVGSWFHGIYPCVRKPVDAGHLRAAIAQVDRGRILGRLSANPPERGV